MTKKELNLPKVLDEIGEIQEDSLVITDCVIAGQSSLIFDAIKFCKENGLSHMIARLESKNSPQKFISQGLDVEDQNISFNGEDYFGTCVVWHSGTVSNSVEKIIN